MTNEEAIIYLERADITVYKEIKTKTAEALEIAIKALEQTDKIEESNFSTEQYKADLQGAYDCGYAKALEQQPRWIPVSERLPEDGRTVLVWYEYFRYGNYNKLFQTYGLSYAYGGHWSELVNGTSGWKDLRIIAWMPLPEPYKEDKK